MQFVPTKDNTTKLVGVAATLYTGLHEVRGSNIGRDISYSD
jgi:hypothetical protein